MAFDLLDPLRLPTVPGLRAAGRAAGTLDLTPEEEQSLAARVAQIPMSGLEFLGNVLGTPGAFITTALAGENPFPGILYPSRRKYGRDVMERWGLLEPNQPGLDIGDVAGFGLDVATDPFTYLPPFGLSKAGRAAQAVGLLKKGTRIGQAGKLESRMVGSIGKLLEAAPETEKTGRLAALQNWAAKQGLNPSDLQQLMGEPLGGLAQLKVPFAEPLATLGTGPTAQKIARGLDVAGGALQKTFPVRLARSLFSPPVEGAIAPEGQMLREIHHELLPEARARASEEAWLAEKNLAPLLEQFPETELAKYLGPQEGPEALANAAGLKAGDVVKAADRENYGRILQLGPQTAKVHFRNPKTMAEAVVDLPYEQLEKTFPAGSPQAEQLLRSGQGWELSRLLRATAERGHDVGAAVKALYPEFQGTFPVGFAEGMEALSRRWHAVRANPYELGRLMGGKREYLEEGVGFAHAPRAAAPKAGEGPEFWRAVPRGFGSERARVEPFAYLPTDIIDQLRADKMARGEGAAAAIAEKYGSYLGKGPYQGDVAAHAAEIADYLAGTRPTATPWTPQTILESHAQYLRGVEKANTGLEAIHEALPRVINQKEGEPLAKAFQAMGMDEETAIPFLAKKLGVAPEALSDAKVPQGFIIEANKLLAKTVKPEWQRVLESTYDKLLSLWKSHVTVPWPAFSVRNLVSGHANNLLSQWIESPGDVTAYLQRARKALRIARRPEDYEDIIHQIAVHDVSGYQRGIGGWDVAMGLEPGQRVPASPFALGETWQEQGARLAKGEAAAKAAAEEAGIKYQPGFLQRHPLAKTAAQAERTLVGSGAKVHQQVEWSNRVTMYLYLTEHKGMDPAVAAKTVKWLQHDYADLAPAEREIFKRIFPFWTYTTRQARLVADQLLSRPGGPLARVIEASGRAHQEGEVMPDYLASTMAFPLPGGPSGAARYLTGFGLGHEDPLQFLSGGARGAGLEALSRMSPLLKFPLEWSTGETFFQRSPEGGRALEDLDPTLGRLAVNLTGQERPLRLPAFLEAAAANTPLSRYATSARVLTDPRKEWLNRILNLTTGARTTDVTPQAEDRLLAQALDETVMAEGGRRYTRSYFPADELAQMTPAERQKAQEITALQKVLDQRAKQRAKLKKITAAP